VRVVVLALCLVGCGDAFTLADLGGVDAEAVDASTADALAPDMGTSEDASPSEASPRDGGALDAAPLDVTSADAAEPLDVSTPPVDASYDGPICCTQGAFIGPCGSGRWLCHGVGGETSCYEPGACALGEVCSFAGDPLDAATGVVTSCN
jgi:hypothetical protein